jgi:hypothetical protein
MMPAMSRPVPKAGCSNCVTSGEFKMVTGSDTVQTQIIWLYALAVCGMGIPSRV